MIEDEDEVLAQSALRLVKWGNFEEAEVTFRRAIKLNPDNAETRISSTEFESFRGGDRRISTSHSHQS